MIGQFYRKRLLRIMIPLVFWTCAYIAWQRYFHGNDRPWSDYPTLILGGETYYHLWFLYTLAGLYLTLPFLSRLLKCISNKETGLFIALWFGGASLLPWLEWMIGFKSAIPLGWFGSYFGFLVLGALFRDVRWSRATQAKCAVILSLACVITIAGTVALSMRDQGSLNENLLVYLAPNIIIISVLGFALLKNADWHGSGDGKSFIWDIISFLSKASLGIYLAHVMVLEIAERHIFLDSGWIGFSGLAAIIVTCLVGTGALVWIGLRIPGLRRVIG